MPMAPRVLNAAARTRIGHPPPGARSERNTVPSRSHSVRSHPRWQRRASTLRRAAGTPYRRASTSYEMPRGRQERGPLERRPDARGRRRKPSERGTDARVRRTKPSEHGTDVPVRSDPRRAPGGGCPILVLAAAWSTRRAMGTVHSWEFRLRAPPLPGCRMNEKRVPDSGRGRTASLGRGRRRRLGV